MKQQRGQSALPLRLRTGPGTHNLKFPWQNQYRHSTLLYYHGKLLHYNRQIAFFSDEWQDDDRIDRTGALPAPRQPDASGEANLPAVKAS